MHTHTYTHITLVHTHTNTDTQHLCTHTHTTLGDTHIKYTHTLTQHWLFQLPEPGRQTGSASQRAKAFRS